MIITRLFKKVRPSAFRSQLILGITLIIVVSISLFVMDLVNRQKNFFLKLNHDRGLSLSDNLANIATSSVVAEELAGLQNLIITYKKMPGLEYAMVTSPDGIVLAHTNDKYLGLRPTDNISLKLKPINATQVLLENNYIFDVASPIIYNDRIVGWARIGVSQKYIEPNITEIKQRGLFYVFISLIAGIAFAIIVAGRLSKGLQKLVTVAKKIREGNRNLRATPSMSIEVTQLGTAINQMLDELTLSESAVRDSFEASAIGMAIVSMEGKFIKVNPELCRMLGYVEQELLSMTFKDISYKEESLNNDIGFVEKAKKNQADRYKTEKRYYHKNRTIVWVNLNSSVVKNDNETPLYFISQMEDITERKRVDEQFKESELKFKNLVEKSLVGVYIIQKGKFIYVNPKFAQLLGYTQEEMLNLEEFRQIVDETYSPPGLLQWRKKLDAGIIDDFHIELKYKRKDGTIIWADVYCGETVYEGAAAILGSFEDITERKRAEEELRKINHDISERVKELRCLYRMSELSHDPNKTMQDILKDCVSVIPPSYQYPEVTCARIEFEGQLFESAHFVETEWKQEQSIIRRGDIIGKVQVYYTEEMPEEIEGPFLSEERLLINSIADILGSSAERKRAEQQISLEKLLSDSIINSLPGIFYMRDKTGKLIRWNKNAELFFGLNKEQAEKLNTLDFVDDSQKALVKESHQEAEQVGISETIVYLKNKEGKSVPYYFTGRKLNFDTDEFVIAIGIDISERIDAENKLTERTLEIQKLSAHLEHAQEEERMRIAREIHDELGQQLTGLKMDAFLVSKNIEKDKNRAQEKISEMVSLIDFTIKTVRRIASDLRPGVLDDLGLMSAIEWQGQEFEKRSGIKLKFESDLPDLNPDRNLSTNVFRVYQEILTNVMRHAKATLVETNLAVKENNIILEVKDNGQGFDFEEVKNKGSLGLVGMKERVLLFNGQLIIDSKKSKGTIVTLRVPIINN